MNHIRAGRDCVAEERQAILPAYRATITERLKTEFPNLEIEFCYFRNDPWKAAQNILSRPDVKKNRLQHLWMILLNSRQYVIPEEPSTLILEIEEPTAYPVG